MNINPLNIGDISLRIPIIQGGMGVGVSLSNLAAAEQMLVVLVLYLQLKLVLKKRPFSMIQFQPI